MRENADFTKVSYASDDCSTKAQLILAAGFRGAIWSELVERIVTSPPRGNVVSINRDTVAG
jgi:hypothetical protein